MTWYPIDIAAKADVEPQLRQCAYPISDYNFTHLIMWQASFHIEYRWFEDHLIIRGKDPIDKCTYVLLPLGGEMTDSLIQYLMHYFNTVSEPLLIRGMTPEMQSKFSERHQLHLVYEPLRDEFEYIYKVEQFKNFDHRKLKEKRHLCRHFEQTYTYEFRLYESKDYKKVIELIGEWQKGKEIDPSSILYYEIEGIKRVLTHYENLSCEGYILCVEENVIGFILIEAITEDMILVHYEKALRSYKGVYEILKHELAKAVHHRAVYLNYEEDMGVAGLRMAKKLYRPSHLMEKGMMTMRKKGAQG